MPLSRRVFFTAGMAAGVFQAHPSSARPSCIFGAIRWDAQYCDTIGQPCAEEEAILGSSRWQFRAPLHAKITGPETIRFEPTQATFDAEIRAASAGGLSYWAYLMYGDADGVISLEHSMMRGLKYHRASAIRSRMNIAMIVQTNTLGAKGTFTNAIGPVAALMSDGDYQRCLDNRPVMFLYYSENDINGRWGGDLANLKLAINALRVSAHDRGLNNPYIVVMTSPPANAERVRSTLGADAISVYATPVPSGHKVPYAELDSSARRYWMSESATAAAGMVPTVMIGWDTRPRKEHPPSWERKTMPVHRTPPTWAALMAGDRQ